MRLIGLGSLFLLAGAVSGAGNPPEARLVWAGADANLLGGPSPDGQLLSYVDATTGDLALRELATGHSRRLTRNAPGSEQFAYFSSVSPDSERVAYAWFNQDRFYELRVISAAGAGERLLYRNEEAGFVQPCAWSPDGKQILTLFFRKDNISQIALVDAGEGSVRVLKSLNWLYPNKMDFSPDGRWIVYDNVAADGATQRDIFLLSADGRREVRLVESPANDIFPVWARDGKAVVFVSDRSGSMDVWLQAVAGDKAAGPPTLVKRNAGRILAMGMTRDGSYYYGLRAGEPEVQVAEVDWAGGRLASKPQRLSDGMAPAWSADGKRLAWLARLGSENFGQESRGIAIGSVEASGQKLLEPRLAHMERLRWSPDGRSLLVSGSDRQNRRGLYRVDAETGAVTPVVQHHSSTYRGFAGAWVSGDKAIVYIQDEEEPGAEIRVRELDGGSERVLYRATPGARLAHLELSPKADAVAFTATAGEGSPEEVLVLPLAGGEPRTLASLRSAGVLGVEWSRDGKSLLVSTPGKPPALWRVAVQGGKPERLPVEMERRDGIRLHPDGRRVAFTSGGSRPEVWVIPKLARQQ